MASSELLMFSACTCMYAVKSVCAVSLHTHDMHHAMCLVGAVTVVCSHIWYKVVHTQSKCMESSLNQRAKSWFQRMLKWTVMQSRV